MSDDARRAPPAAAAAMAQESFSDYHLYTLGRKTTINNNETKQVSMLSGTGVPVRKRYVVDGQAFYYRNGQHPGLADQGRRAGVLPVQERGAAPGSACRCRPASCASIRPTRRAARSSSARIASTTRRRTKTLNLKIGNAFDVVCERNQIDFEKIAANVYEIEYEITLRNHKATPITVEVNEPIGGTWRMIRSSHEWTKTGRVGGAVHGAGRGGRRQSCLKYRVRVTY